MNPSERMAKGYEQSQSKKKKFDYTPDPEADRIAQLIQEGKIDPDPLLRMSSGYHQSTKQKAQEAK